MGRVVYVTGGRRSGKSAFAQAMAESFKGKKVYIATCPVLDDEMAARIEAHKKSREGKGWISIEETLDLAGAIRGVGDANVVLVECLTLWVNNLLYSAETEGREVSTEEVKAEMKKTLEAIGDIKGDVILVSNEVGWGIVPENPLARKFADMAGIVNQLAASEAGEAYVVISGIPQKMK